MAEKRMTKLEANKLRDEGKVVETFNHSTIGHFNITMMRSIQKENPHAFPEYEMLFENIRAEGQVMTGAQVIEWLAGQREVDEERLAALTPEELEEPVIIVFDIDNDNQAYTVDGIHRQIGRFRRGDKTFKFYAWPLSMCPMVPKELAEAFDRPWGVKDVVGDKLVDINTGEKT